MKSFVTKQHIVADTQMATKLQVNKAYTKLQTALSNTSSYLSSAILSSYNDLDSKINNSDYTSWQVYPNTEIITTGADTVLSSRGIVYQEIQPCHIQQFRFAMNIPDTIDLVSSDVFIDFGDNQIIPLTSVCPRYSVYVTHDYSNGTTIVSGKYGSTVAAQTQEYKQTYTSKRGEFYPSERYLNHFLKIKVYGKQYYKISHSETYNILSRVMQCDLPLASHLINYAFFATYSKRLLSVFMKSYLHSDTIYNMNATFQNCRNLSIFNISSGNRFPYCGTCIDMFDGCINLRSSNFKIPMMYSYSETESGDACRTMYCGCYNLSGDVSKLFPLYTGFANKFINLTWCFAYKDDQGYHEYSKLTLSEKNAKQLAKILWNDTTKTFIGCDDKNSSRGKLFSCMPASVKQYIPKSWGGTSQQAVLSAVTLNQVKSVSSFITDDYNLKLDAKASINNPSFTGTVKVNNNKFIISENNIQSIIPITITNGVSNFTTISANNIVSNNITINNSGKLICFNIQNGTSKCYAGGNPSHAQGTNTSAYYEASHSQGYITLSNAKGSHAEGQYTSTLIDYSHAEGMKSITSGKYSHAEGVGTLTREYGQHAEGLWNKGLIGYQHIVGGVTQNPINISSDYITPEIFYSLSSINDYGIADTFKEDGIDYVKTVYKRKNIQTLDWKGNQWLAGNLSAISVFSDGKKCLTEQTDPIYKETSGKFALKEDIPTKISQLSDDIPLVSSYQLNNYYTKSEINTNCLNSTNPSGNGNFILDNGNIHITNGIISASNFITNGSNGFAIGCVTHASGDYSHAEGNLTKAIGRASHAEGNLTKAEGYYSHTEGYNTYTSGDLYSYAHAEGYSTSAIGRISHAQGYGTITSGSYSHTQGYGTIAKDHGQHAEGLWNKGLIGYQHIVGGNFTSYDISNQYITPEQFYVLSSIDNYGIYNTFDENNNTYVKTAIKRNNIQTLDWNGNLWNAGNVSSKDFITNDGNHKLSLKANINNPTFTGNVILQSSAKFMFGTGDINNNIILTTVSGSIPKYFSVGNGQNKCHNTNTQQGAVTMGINCHVSGEATFAQGYSTKAYGKRSHAEGRETYTKGQSSHAQGISTSAMFYGSHVQGWSTKSAQNYQHVQGKYNQIKSGYQHIVGGGTSENKRENIQTLDWKGNQWLAGTITASAFFLKNGRKIGQSTIYNGTVTNNIYNANYNSGDFHQITVSSNITISARNIPNGEGLTIYCNNSNGNKITYGNAEIISESGEYLISFISIDNVIKMCGAAVKLS